MKQWVQKFIEQLDYSWIGPNGKVRGKADISEERATILYIIDTYNKNLLELEGHPVRRVRETLDGFAKELVAADKVALDKILFRFRQFFSNYRVDEYTYMRKTLEDFKGIVWDFVDQIAEDFKHDQAGDKDVLTSLNILKEAVESDSIDILRTKSREFIDFYMEVQSKREIRRNKRFKGIKKNLDVVKKKLVEADRSAKLDHLTGAENRRSFDENLKQQVQLFTLSKVPCSMIILDIDFFKKINDNYGHDIGDCILKECVRMLKESFNRENDFVARIGGEEFAILLPELTLEQAVQKAEECLVKIRKEVYVTQNMEIRFTVSMGIAQVIERETGEQWLKRADKALYHSKHNGRNRYTLAGTEPELGQAA